MKIMNTQFLVLIISLVSVINLPGLAAQAVLEKESLSKSDSAASLDVDDETSIAVYVEKAMNWLLDYCKKDHMFGASAANDRAKSRIVLLQTAFLLEIMPEAFQDDDRRRIVLNKAERILAEGVGSDFAFESWVAGFASIYAFERSVRDGNRHPSLQMLGDSWIDRQNREGGWSHGGAGRMVNFYPSTILSASNFALIGLGAIKELDHKLKNSIEYQDVVEEAIAMYEKAQSRRGGLPYGARTYQKGVQSGRTATSLIGLVALGFESHDLFCRAAHYSVTNVDTVPFGHASPAMHMGCGALAFAMLGGEHWQTFKDCHFGRLAKQQKQDGSFGDFAGGPDSMIGGTEVSTAYITSMYTICFCANQSQFIHRLGNKFVTSDVLARGKQLVNEACVINAAKENRVKQFVNRVQMQSGERLLHLGNLHSKEVAGIVSSDQESIRWVDIKSGKSVAITNLKQTLEPDATTQFTNDRFIVVSNSSKKSKLDVQAVVKQSQNEQPVDVSDKGDNIRVRSYQVSTGKLNWERALPSLSRVHLRKNSGDFLGISGKELHRVDLESGKFISHGRTVEGMINFGLFGNDGGNSFVAVMGKLVKHDRDGVQNWASRLKGMRGMIQPSPVNMVAQNGRVYVSTAYGTVNCYDAASGKRLWKLESNGIVELMLSSKGELFAVGNDGLLRKISTEVEVAPGRRRIWVRDIGSGLEKIVDGEANSSVFQYFALVDRLVVRDTVSRKVSVVDAESGELLFETFGDDVQATDKMMVVADEERLTSWIFE